MQKHLTLQPIMTKTLQLAFWQGLVGRESGDFVVVVFMAVIACMFLVET